eukprot:CAMPEP_0119331476 /NCGR_PEP_ID=MMETSP1333-20130426/80700_1 /TAXON_ID=418940 /ORGANISM="Scyphosphaera apsteinii, Strain RCC1455" /LENGTH=280 /DNA_ID=CAMNT_0007341093 /DNA_START=67 /DNA_END=909 /DNA_ORIENTATION=+
MSVADNEGADARALASRFKGLDTSRVEVDEEQEPASIAASSSEEATAFAAMEEMLAQQLSAEAISASNELKLMCLRGRKYDPVKGAKLVSELLALKADIELSRSDNHQLKEDICSHKFIATGGKDACGRGVLWMRFRFHDPTRSKPLDMARLITTVVLHALQDSDCQRNGFVIIQDMTGVRLKNIDPSAAKFVFSTVFPRLPVRIGRICLFNPPWLLGHFVLPIVMSLMTKKLRGRIAVLNGNKPEKLHAFVSPCALTEAHGGTMAFNEQAWCDTLVQTL